MGERRCRYCEKTFRPSKYQAQQTVCSESLCQKRRRTEYRQQKLKTDEEYRQVCRDSSRKWRSENPDYWKRYREKHPEAVAQNREKQQGRDGKQRLLDLANNTSVLDLKPVSYTHLILCNWSGNRRPCSDLGEPESFKPSPECQS